jgi:hypothetical protein
VVRERPILFRTPMVRAILAGKKTRTRRVMKPQPPSTEDVYRRAGHDYHLSDIGTPGTWRPMGPVWAVRELLGSEPQWRCPYGVPGDRLWVREAWSHDAPDLASCRAAHEDSMPGLGYGPYYRATEVAPDTLRWIPSIHMPRWASRITLEVTSVRVERLHEISEADARAEGVDTCVVDPSPRGMRVKPKHYSSERECFADLWREINGADSWDANPWVWVIGFQMIEPARKESAA